MKDSTFEKYMTAARSIGNDYGNGYITGLRKHKNPDNFGTQENHERYMSKDSEIGEGYRDGFSGKPPRDTHFNTGNEHAKKDDTKESQIIMRVLQKEKTEFIKAAQNSEHKKLTPWILAACREKLEKQ